MSAGFLTRTILFATTAWLLIACEHPEVVDHEGRIILSSAFNFTESSIYGYHFESATFIRFPTAADPGPDIILDKFTRLNGDIFPGFSSPSNPEGFALVAESGDLTESYSYYLDYHEFDTTALLSPNTDTVRVYQLWVLKTNQDKYVKINVRDIRLVKDLTGDHLEVSIDYFYQEDGTPLF